MSNVPLPIRSCIVTYMGDGRGLHYTLGVAAGTALIEQPPGSQLDLYTADQMRSYAAAATAAKAAEIAALRAEVAGLRAELLKSLADNAPLRERVKVLEDALLRVARMAEALKKDCGMDPESPQAVRNGQYMNISYAARAALAARKGEA